LVSLYSTIKMMHGPINIRCCSNFNLYNYSCVDGNFYVTYRINLIDLNEKT